MQSEVLQPGRAGRHVLVIRQGDRPRLNGELPHRLQQAFPDLLIDDLDVLAAVRRRRFRWMIVAASGTAEFAVPVLRRQIRPKRAIVRSAAFASAVERCVHQQVSGTTHRFTFQSQSLFPAATPGVPHFIYTDHAHLANVGYPGFDRRTLLGGRHLAREVRTYEEAAAVFTRSRHVADVLTSAYAIPRDRVHVVGVGPNISTSDRAVTSKWHDGRIVFVGVDWDRKGGPVLLEAFRRLHAEDPATRLEIVGCDPDLDDNGVTVHGRLPLGQVARLLAESDVFCLPTLAEPFGVAFVEAMHAGLPIVGTEIGAIPEMVGAEPTGLLVRPGDVADLHKALVTLVRDPALARRLGAQGRRVAAERYDWDLVMERIRSVILERLPNGGGKCR
jgi:glycosyltransferase involved in cell wall biosynthesis